MKTLIFNGSPRPHGDTASLLDFFTDRLGGEIKQVNAYNSGIHPCTDCRYCWKHPGCVIQDGMQEVYPWIIDCDHIVIASPIYFSELTGPLLSVLSRVQTLYCAHAFRGEEKTLSGKYGQILLVGGGDGGMERAQASARVLLRQMGVDHMLPTVSFHNTNHCSALEDAAVRQQLIEAAAVLQAASAGKV